MQEQNTMRPVAVLMGPTASGKSSFAIDLVLKSKLPFEIVNMDSSLVYKDMDIGTAKPTPEEMAAVPHHLVDVVTPLESYNANDFVEDVKRLAMEIRSRGNEPLVCGGTMMYFNALKGGMNDLPSSDEEARGWSDALKESLRKSGGSLHAELAKVDPEMAAKLPEGDTQRITRALEIHHMTGKSMTRLLLETPKKAGVPLYEVALVPSDKMKLHEGIARRLETMIEMGFVDEIRNLLEKYPGLNPEHQSMRSVGYRQLLPHALGEEELAPALEKAVFATRHLAKRQLTWLRKLAPGNVVDTAILSKEEAFAKVEAFMLDFMLDFMRGRG